MYKNYFKRILDFILAFVILTLTSPIIVVVAILILGIYRENPFFVQSRPGLNENCFRIIKFRTMNGKKNMAGELLADSKRLTRAGKFLRKTSIDELPQLINVLKGDMAIIGPRPLLSKYLPHYTDEERLRHTIRPGITGWAQVNGRNTLNWNERLAYDVQYVNSVGLAFDLKILYKTVLKIIVAEDIVVDPESIMKNLDDER